ncbi:MAG: ribonuclease Z [Candidatus Sericytochromatia bacterium]|nr:ribonuclease Z [Candidatus Sericytochromatia bacterium]
MQVVFLGTSGAVPTPERGLTATLLKRGGERVLVDCGEGTQRQLMRAGVGINQIGVILLTHFHADHYLGLPGMLKTWELWGRQEPVAIYGPKGLTSMVTMFRRIVGSTTFEVSYHQVEAGHRFERDDWVITAIATDHRVASLGWSFVEPARPGRFDAARAEALGLKPGPDFGALQRGETVEGSQGPVSPAQVLGPSRSGRRVVVTGDTRPCQAVAEASQDADLLVHDATFAEEAADRARETYHSTAAEAARLALEARVKMLALTHISFRHAARDLLAEAHAIQPGVILPHDLDRVELPFPERGGPVWVDHRQERAQQRLARRQGVS